MKYTIKQGKQNFIHFAISEIKQIFIKSSGMSSNTMKQPQNNDQSPNSHIITPKPKNMDDFNRQKQLINRIEHSIFEYTKNLNNYHKAEINIGGGQVLNTYFIKGTGETGQFFYISHGFGGTSLMFFPTLNMWLQKGNIVLWEVRGMGIGIKSSYQQIPAEEINKFYVDGLRSIIKYYNHPKITFISHSLSAYITFRYMMQYPQDKRISKAIFLSPVGITAKQRDINNTINSFTAFLNALINSFGWKFRLTFKSPLRTVLRCFKRQILNKAFSQFHLTKEQNQLMLQLFLALVELSDGSENIFFTYFLPRVLPPEGQSIQQLLKPNQVTKNISIYYGGEQDWVDKSGAQRLCQQNPNIKVHILEKCGHMICFNKQQMNYVFNGETK